MTAVERQVALDDCRALYFTHREGVLSALAPGPEDEAALERLNKEAESLSRAAKRLRHNLPSRAVEVPKLKHTSGYRYFVMHPDGEVVGHAYFMQRPAAVKRATIARRGRPEIRLWDDREKTWIEVDG